MSAIGIIILVLLIAGIVVIRYAAFAGLVFIGLALVLFVNTPAGSGVPGAIGEFFTSVNNAATPALNGQSGSQS